MKLLQWFKDHKFEAHLLAFLLMTIPSVFLYIAAQGGATGWIWVLLIPVVIGNIFVLVL
jgi:hypothetical protein